MVDHTTVGEALRRLKRIEGQVKGLERMVEEGRYCIDILDQVSAVQGALGQIGRIVTRQHLATCVQEAFRSGPRAEKAKKIKELMTVVSRFGR